MRADEQAKWQATVTACLEYLTLASNPSPLAQLAREGLMRELNALQLLIGRGLHLVPRREGRNHEAPLFDEAIVLDLQPPQSHPWQPEEVYEATRRLPAGFFAGDVFDRIAMEVSGRPHTGISLVRALAKAGVVEPVGVNHQGDEDPRGPFLRFRKV